MSVLFQNERSNSPQQFLKIMRARSYKILKSKRVFLLKFFHGDQMGITFMIPLKRKFYVKIAPMCFRFLFFQSKIVMTAVSRSFLVKGMGKTRGGHHSGPYLRVESDHHERGEAGRGSVLTHMLAR